jgi:hypothetical protein
LGRENQLIMFALVPMAHATLVGIMFAWYGHQPVQYLLKNVIVVPLSQECLYSSSEFHPGHGMSISKLHIYLLTLSVYTQGYSISEPKLRRCWIGLFVHVKKTVMANVKLQANSIVMANKIEDFSSQWDC